MDKNDVRYAFPRSGDILVDEECDPIALFVCEDSWIFGGVWLENGSKKIVEPEEIEPQYHDRKPDVVEWIQVQV